MARRRLSLLLAVLLTSIVMFIGLGTPASAQVGSSVGVEVEAPPTTTTTAAPPTTTTTAAPKPTTTTTPPTTTTTVEVKQPTAVADRSPAGLSGLTDETVKEVVKEQTEKSVVGSVKNAAKVAKTFFSEVAKGTPVADVAAAVLPEEVATVVVPAVRTASTFAFPIGLAIAVLAFLVLQQRIDSTDPKLTAAPLAHEDDVVKFS